MKNNTKHLLTNMLWLLPVLLLTGCTQTYTIFDLPCGEGRLVLYETYSPGFDYSASDFELFYIVNNQKRKVATLRHDTLGLFRDPLPKEQYHHFRENPEHDPAPLRVDATQFTLAEYEQIRQTIAANLARIDASMLKRKGKPVDLPGRRKPRITSIIYLDPRDYNKFYRSETYGFVIKPEGGAVVVGPSTEDGRKEMIVDGETWFPKGEMGLVINNGRTLIIPPDGEWIPGVNKFAPPIAEVPDRYKLAEESFSKEGRSAFDDFEVIRAEDEETYRLAIVAFLKQRDKFR